LPLAIAGVDKVDAAVTAPTPIVFFYKISSFHKILTFYY
jgi:hypothetical protein